MEPQQLWGLQQSDLEYHVTPEEIWPPNHKLLNVVATVNVIDTLSGSSGFTLVSVTSNEPDADPNDLQGWTLGIADLNGQLRAERSATGFGRVYTLSYRGVDAAGNIARCNVAVSVPHDQRNK